MRPVLDCTSLLMNWKDKKLFDLLGASRKDVPR